LPVWEYMLQISTSLILIQIAFTNWKCWVTPLSFKAISIFRCFFLASILWVLFIIIIYLLIVILVMMMSFRLNVRSHRCQQPLLIFSLLLLFVNIWVNLLLLNHSHWFFPDRIWSPLQFSVNIFKIITASGSRVEWIYSLEFISRYVLINKMIIKFDPITMLLNCHSPSISILHS